MDDCGDLGRPMQLIRRSPLGVDLDVLDIFGPEMEGQGVCLLEGYSGMYHAERTIIEETTAYSEGSYPTDNPRVESRKVEFTLGTQGRTPAEWERVETRLWRFLKFDRECILRVYSVLSGWRELKIRLFKKPDDLFNRGPGLVRYKAWKIQALASDPWWYSEELGYQILRSQMAEVNETTGAPQAGTGIWQGLVPMVNYADQGCWPEFTCNQLTTNTTFTLPDGVSGRLVKLPVLTAGKEFYVRTNPLVETLLVRDDSQQWANMDAGYFESKLPEGLATPVNAPVRIQGGTSTTAVKMYLPQRWDRMYGGEPEMAVVA